MNIILPGMRDRRVAASDERRARARNKKGEPKQIFGKGTRPRRFIENPRYRGLEFNLQNFTPSRNVSQLHSIILHQTAKDTNFSLPNRSGDNDITDYYRWDCAIAHFVITRQGIVVYTHDIQYRLNSVSSTWGIDIEFEGAFSHTQTPQGNRLESLAIIAGRNLVKALASQVSSITHIHPHGQLTSGSKVESCPGPDIWVNVGEWAKENVNSQQGHRLKSHPPKFHRFRHREIAAAQKNPSYKQ